MKYTFGYDLDHRVTSATHEKLGANPVSNAYSTTYGYDAAGNIQNLCSKTKNKIRLSKGPIQLEVVDGQLEQYHFGNGRVAFEANGTPHFQYTIKDHLGWGLVLGVSFLPQIMS